MSLVLIAGPQDGGRGESFRWGAAFVVALALHLLGALALVSWRNPAEPPPELPPAIMIDLEPAPSPPVAAAVPPPPEVAPPDPVPPPPVELPPPPVEIPPPPVLAVQPVVPLPPPPPPKPVQITRHSPYKAPKPVVAAPPTEVPPQQQAVVAPPAPPMPAAPPAAAPIANPLPSFRALMAAHLEHYKRYPHQSQLKGEEGTVLLRFRMDRKGSVLAAQIDQKSGHTLLDEEVLALVRRAEPLPAIPAEMTENELELVVPVKFSLH